MKMYLVRHGESDFGEIDDHRILSEKGQKDIHYLADLLLPLQINISTLLQSKKQRAQQTASILMPSIHIENGVQTRLELDPMASVNPLIKELITANQDVMVVGHMPFLGKLIGKLILNDESESVVALRPGSFICLEQVEGQYWLISWMLNPDMRLA